MFNHSVLVCEVLGKTWMKVNLSGRGQFYRYFIYNTYLFYLYIIFQVQSEREFNRSIDLLKGI